MTGQVNYLGANGIDPIPVTQATPLPVAVAIASEGLPPTPAGAATHSEALLEQILEVTKRQTAFLAAILVTAGNNGGGFVDPSEVFDLLGADSTPLLS